MRPTRPLATGVAVWLIVVAVGSAVVWAVISRAGEGVVSSEAPVSATTDQSGRTSDPTSRPTQTTTSPPTADPPAADPPGADPVQRTWAGVGGEVSVVCQGSAAALDSLVPDSGFVFEIDDRGPDRVRVEFEGQDDDTDRRSRVESVCVDGIPTFEVDVDQD